MSTVTVSIVQNVQIKRAAASSDAADVGATVADIVQRDLLPAAGLDWATLAVSVADDPVQ